MPYLGQQPVQGSLISDQARDDGFVPIATDQEILEPDSPAPVDDARDPDLASRVQAHVPSFSLGPWICTRPTPGRNRHPKAPKRVESFCDGAGTTVPPGHAPEFGPGGSQLRGEFGQRHKIAGCADGRPSRPQPGRQRRSAMSCWPASRTSPGCGQIWCRAHDWHSASTRHRNDDLSWPARRPGTARLSCWSSVRRGDHPVAWLSLDAGDNDPARFCRHTVAALDHERPGVSDRIGPLLGLPPPPPLEPLVTALINEVAGQPDADEARLVLDDYHVISTQLVHESLSFLLEVRGIRRWQKGRFL